MRPARWTWSILNAGHSIKSLAPATARARAPYPAATPPANADGIARMKSGRLLSRGVDVPERADVERHSIERRNPRLAFAAERIDDHPAALTTAEDLNRASRWINKPQPG